MNKKNGVNIGTGNLLFLWQTPGECYNFMFLNGYHLSYNAM
jgi:hypothetical protein